MDNNLQVKLLTIWRNILDNQRLTIDDDFFGCGGDSLLATRLLLEIEAVIGKRIDLSALFETGTVRSLVKRLDGDCSKAVDSFIVGDPTAPIFHFFHGDYTWGGVSVHSFANVLADSYAIHAIGPHLPTQIDAPSTIQAMAQDRINLVLRTQTSGPFILGGHCNGALVAAEVARILLGMNHDVKLLIMIDPVVVSLSYYAQAIFTLTRFSSRLRGASKEALRIQLRKKWLMLSTWNARTKDFYPKLRRYVVRFSKKLSSRQLNPNNSTDEPIDPNCFPQYKKDFNTFYEDAMVLYKPNPLDVNTIFVTLHYRGHAWRKINPNTRFINVRFGHHFSLREHYSADLLALIRQELIQHI